MAIKVLMLQPALPKYRIPVFRELAARPGIELTVGYGRTKEVPNVTAEGFDAVEVAHRTMPLAKMTELLWEATPGRLLAPGACDVVVNTWNLRYLSLVPALMRTRLLGVPQVLWGHGYSKHERGLNRWLRTRLAGMASTIVVYNFSIADALARAGVERRRLFVALNAIDQRPVQEARAWWLERPGELAAFRRQHGLEGGPNLLFVSRLEPLNRIEWLVEATALLRRRHPGVRTVIIGGGQETARLKAQVARLGLESAVTMTGAIYEERELAPWFLSAHVYAYPANIGLSVLHAHGYGLPVVTSDRLAEQNPEIEALRPGETGLLYKHGSVEAFAEAIEGLWLDRERRERMGEEARLSACERFTVSRMVDGLEGAIRSAAEDVQR